MKRVWVLDSQWLDNASRKKSKILLDQGETVFIWPKEYGTVFKDFNDIAKKLNLSEIPERFILDDCITTANAHEYEKQINWLQKEVITRLGKNGKLLIVGTRIAAQDFYKELREAKHWSGGKSPFTYMGMPAVLEYSEKPEDWKTLWPKSDLPWDGDTDVPDKEGFFPKWDGKALFRRRSEVTPQTWALVYQQEDVSEDSIFPPAIVQGCINGQRKRGLQPVSPSVMNFVSHLRRTQILRPLVSAVRSTASVPI